MIRNGRLAAIVLVAVDAAFPVGTLGALSSDPLAPVRLLGVAAVGLLGSVGAQTVVTMLVATGRVPNTDRLDAAAGGLALDGKPRKLSLLHWRPSNSAASMLCWSTMPR